MNVLELCLVLVLRQFVIFACVKNNKLILILSKSQLKMNALMHLC